MKSSASSIIIYWSYLDFNLTFVYEVIGIYNTIARIILYRKLFVIFPFNCILNEINSDYFKQIFMINFYNTLHFEIAFMPYTNVYFIIYKTHSEKKIFQPQIDSEASPSEFLYLMWICVWKWKEEKNVFSLKTLTLKSIIFFNQKNFLFESICRQRTLYIQILRKITLKTTKKCNFAHAVVESLMIIANQYHHLLLFETGE